MLIQGGLQEPYHPRIETVAIMAAHAPEMDQSFFFPKQGHLLKWTPPSFPTWTLDQLQIDQNEVIFF